MSSAPHRDIPSRTPSAPPSPFLARKHSKEDVENAALMANFINQNINGSAREPDGQEPQKADHDQGASNSTAAPPQEISEYHNIDDA
ncbi:hypothetical protein LTS18_006341, partial [Coniosporium uncinatum]